MDEIDEVAQAIHEKHPLLWPLTSYQASYVAEKEAGDQGFAVVDRLADALLKLNRPHLSPTNQARHDGA